jgi:hypothetical protein
MARPASAQAEAGLVLFNLRPLAKSGHVQALIPGDMSRLATNL